MNLQIVSEDRVAGKIGNEAERRCGHHDRYDCKPVETICQVYGIACAHHDEGCKRNEEPAQIDDELLGKRECQRRRERLLPCPHDDERGNSGDQEFDAKTRLAGKTLVGLLRHLEIIIIEADGAETHRNQQNDPDIDAGQIGPEQA